MQCNYSMLYLNELTVDIDECANNNTSCPIADNKECRNTNGSYTCNCIPDFIESGPNGVCRGKYRIAENFHQENVSPPALIGEDFI